ncbi:hypothetical protein [Carboxylicivirga sp. N1Y90]|uniref:hypothetical protein n=1 Tax=Carboxylicivirga fragile TaxID=3417571 RepID=UPI003D35381D|nr:hypothetical protein [Marinilabiliaceae bacterium N1Y90]
MNKVTKRQYISPKLEVHQIDNEISLILMTSETDPPDPPRRGAAQEENPFESNPFEETK